MASSVDGALDVIARLSASPQSPSALARELGVHHSTALRLVQTLELRGFARRGASGRWVAGFELISIMQKSLGAISVREVARPQLQLLSNHRSHLHLAERVETDVIYIGKFDGGGHVEMRSRIGARAQLHTAAVAKALVAFAPAGARALAMRKIDYARYTPTTITSEEQLSREYELISRRGWAVDDGEFEDWLTCIAVPVFDRNGDAVAGISLTSLRAIASVDQLQRMLPLILGTRDSISRELGWSGTVTR
ncbi:IclR family transcriptional regulator [Microbacterium sp. AK031]|uniref:IclR family transcriptional regulator n=1 Tax=Microbacterium sp. AK031 TaxID=2723076 RepID=UPI002166DFA2|nr:IclR family transcriptional regulator [Microbacterium sp. AK031]MCS3844131.1 DNA-binding IclR family transcriptional regulator [Microbacterium sp. AK031]